MDHLHINAYFARETNAVIGFRFVDEHQAEYRIVDLCRVAEVSRSAYYAWRSRTPSARQRGDAELLAEIREIHPGVAVHLRGAAGLGSAPPRRAPGRPPPGGAADAPPTGSSAPTPAASGARDATRRWPRPRTCCDRDFSAERSDLRWVADITEFACSDGKLYLAGIRDLYDHTLVGWSMGERQTTDLVVAALVMALGRREPSRRAVAPRGPRSCQYTSVEFTNRLADWELRRLLRQRR